MLMLTRIAHRIQRHAKRSRYQLLIIPLTRPGEYHLTFPDKSDSWEMKVSIPVLAAEGNGNTIKRKTDLSLIKLGTLPG